jgi:hypothetical protein
LPVSNQSELQKHKIIMFLFSNQKVPGSPLFCQDYNGVYGLAGIHWGMAYAGEHGYLKVKGPKISKAIFLKKTTKKCPNINTSL